MSLLKALLSALANQQAKPQNVIPTPSPLPNVTPIHGVPNRAVQEVYGGEDGLARFLALSGSEQVRILSAEIAKLPIDQQRLVHEALLPDLQRKWIPQPGPQTQALRSLADITLYGGQGGGGKTDLGIGLAMTEHKRSLIMRREYDDLSFITERACEINGTRTGFSQSPHPTLRTQDGRLIEFRAAQHLGHEQKQQGRPRDLLVLDEAAQFLKAQVDFLMGWVRTVDPNQRTRIVFASNPPLSDEGFWLIEMFGPWLDPGHTNPAKPGELRWYIRDAAGDDVAVGGPDPAPIGDRMVYPMSRTFIPARLADNIYLTRTDDYARKLDALPEPLRSIVRDGNFMAARQDDAFQVIPSDWVRQAQARWTQKPPANQTMTCVALDPAGGGKDAATIAHRYGTWFGPIISEKGPQTADGRYMGARVLMERRNGCLVVVDMGGGYGFEVVNVLKDNEQAMGEHVIHGFKGSDASTGKAMGSGLEFANMRAEVWWRFREKLDPVNGEKIALPPDAELLADLCTPRLDARALQVRGKIQVESKEEIRDRLGRSPDKGDAVVMCDNFGGLLEHEKKTLGMGRPRVFIGHENAKRRAGMR